LGKDRQASWIEARKEERARNRRKGYIKLLIKMGKLIKNHWARLIVLTAAVYQIAASIEGFFWPKIFWDFLTKNLDGAVKPIPFLQIINLLFGLIILTWEWPLKYIAGTTIHRSIETRLVIFPVAALAASLLYQATNPAIYYVVGMGVYFWAYSEGEVIAAEAWSLPRRTPRQVGKV